MGFYNFYFYLGVRRQYRQKQRQLPSRSLGTLHEFLALHVPHMSSHMCVNNYPGIGNKTVIAVPTLLLHGRHWTYFNVQKAATRYHTGTEMLNNKKKAIILSRVEESVDIDKLIKSFIF
jgi:hypothetical protein